MAQTTKGIIYPSDETQQATICDDLRTMAESIDSALDNVSIEIDSSLSTTSENAVQNKVIALKVNEIESSIGDISTALDTINGEVV